MPFGIIGGIGSLIGGIGSIAAGNQQSNAANRAADLQWQEYQDIANKLAPFLKGGYGASQLMTENLLGFNFDTGQWDPNATLFRSVGSTVGPPPDPTDPTLREKFRQSPGFNYQLQTSADAIQNSSAGRSGAVSGNMLKALQANASGLAGQDWNNFYGQMNTNYGQRYTDEQGRRNQLVSVLQNLMSGGQAAATNTGQFGMQAVSNIGNNMNLGASANAAGLLGGLNGFSGLIQSLLGRGGGGGSSSGQFAPGLTDWSDPAGGNYGGGYY